MYQLSRMLREGLAAVLVYVHVLVSRDLIVIEWRRLYQAAVAVVSNANSQMECFAVGQPPSNRGSEGAADSSWF